MMNKKLIRSREEAESIINSWERCYSKPNLDLVEEYPCILVWEPQTPIYRPGEETGYQDLVVYFYEFIYKTDF